MTFLEQDILLLVILCIQVLRTIVVQVKVLIGFDGSHEPVNRGQFNDCLRERNHILSALWKMVFVTVRAVLSLRKRCFPLV